LINLKLSPDTTQNITDARNRKKFATTTDVRRAVLGGASKRDLTGIFKLSPSEADAIIKSRQTLGSPAAIEEIIGKDRLDGIDTIIVALAEKLAGMKIEPRITTGPCSNVQVGGNNNRQTSNCITADTVYVNLGPPPRPVLSQSQEHDLVASLPGLKIRINVICGEEDTSASCWSFIRAFAKVSDTIPSFIGIPYSGVVGVSWTDQNPDSSGVEQKTIDALNSIGIKAEKRPELRRYLLPGDKYDLIIGI